eukprot:SAG11_NODE_10660_length_813_cov_3.614846_1_plen_95_part_00
MTRRTTTPLTTPPSWTPLILVGHSFLMQHRIGLAYELDAPGVRFRDGSMMNVDRGCSKFVDSRKEIDANVVEYRRPTQISSANATPLGRNPCVV